MSILLNAGIITKSFTIALIRFSIVWACMPFVTSTSNIAPSTAFNDLDTSYEKSICPGVSIKLNL